MAYPPWANSEADVVYDEFGNPILGGPRSPGPLPFDPGPTPIPSTPPDPRQSGVNALPIDQAAPGTGIPPWAQPPQPGAAPPPPPEPAPPPVQSPVEQQGLQSQSGNELMVPPWAQEQAQTSQMPRGLGLATEAAQERIPFGGNAPPSAISRTPGLFEQEGKNIREMGYIQTEKAQKRADFIQAANEEQTRLDADYERSRQERATQRAAARERLNKDREEYANGTVDPRRWRERNGFVGNLAYGLAAFLSGLANPQGPNQIVEWINREIDRDLQAQRDELMKKGNALSMGQNLYADMVREHGDLEQADRAFRAHKLATAQNQIMSMEAQFAPEEQKILTQQTLVETEKRRRQLEAEYGMKEAEFEAKQEKEAFDRHEKQTDQLLRKYDIDVGAETSRYGTNVGAATARRGQDIELAKKQNEQAEKDAALMRGSGVAHPGTGKVVGYFKLGTEPEWRRAREHGAQYYAGRKAYDEYISLVRKGVTTKLSDSERTRAKAAYAEIVGNWKAIKEMGAWDKGLQLLGEQAIPPPSVVGDKGWFDIPGELIDASLAEKTEALEDNARRLGEGIDASFNSLGYTGGEDNPTFSSVYSAPAGKQKGKTEVDNPRVQRSSQVVEEDDVRRYPPNVRPLETPRIGR